MIYAVCRITGMELRFWPRRWTGASVAALDFRRPQSRFEFGVRAGRLWARQPASPARGARLRRRWAFTRPPSCVHWCINEQMGFRLPR